MKKKTSFSVFIAFVVVFILFKYFFDGLKENTRGISISIMDSEKKKTLIAEYEPIKSVLFDSILGGNTCKKVWLEKAWYYKRWNNIEVSDHYYTLIVEIQGVVNDLNYALFHEKWLVELVNTDKFESNFYCTRNEDKYIFVCRLKQSTKLDSLTFNVETLQFFKKIGQIQFVRVNK